ncbi:MAG: acyl--CoA ligase [Gammaproteobacteria bacterium]|nr:acyl--CoA ligase [Gammaproteobacteria bacterium]
MLSREEVKQDLLRLKEIAIKHMAPGTSGAIHKEVIDGIELNVFSHIPQTLGEVYRLGLEISDRDFLVYQDERFTFGETYDLASKLARILIGHYDISAGDRVAICSRNNPQWCIAYMAITMIGAIVVPMNSWWTGREMKYPLEDSGCKLLIADQQRIDRIRPFLDSLDLQIIAIKPDSGQSFPEFHQLIEEKECTDINLADVKVSADDSASIMYTSGATGLPKGVLSSHRNITHSLYSWLFAKEINDILRPELVEENPPFEPSILANVPLFHVTGCNAQFLACFVNQRKFVMMYKWNAEAALRLIEQERITVLHGVPTMTWEIMESPDFEKTDLSSLRSVQSGGAARPPEHLALMLKKFPAMAIPGLGYGLTETSAIGAIITGKFYQANPRSTGRPVPPVTQIKIVDEHGNTLGTEQVGDICIKGPCVMKGYWNNPEDTRAVLKDGWFHSGDIGMLDDLNFLTILDRAKDIVIRGGENIGCAEVEYAIAEHSAVSEVSVYGIPDNRLGEIPCASVMLKPEKKLESDELKIFLKNKLAQFKIPEHIFFQYEQLPRIASGKIAKKQLREQVIAQTS